MSEGSALPRLCLLRVFSSSHFLVKLFLFVVFILLSCDFLKIFFHLLLDNQASFKCQGQALLQIVSKRFIKVAVKSYLFILVLRKEL